jgi:hypothetical protein
MINEVTLIPPSETKETNPLQVSKPSSNKEALVITLPVEKRLPAPQKEFPISKWTMPAEPHGYIQGHDNDCL